MITLVTPTLAHRDTIFQQQLDQEANLMAAFTSKDPANREAFDQHYERNLANPENINKTILVDGKVAGHIAKFILEDQPEVTYWIGKEFWGKGVATQALQIFLKEINIQPIYARTAFDNHGSAKVLQKCGFVIDRKDQFFSNARNSEIEELIWIRK